MDALRFIAILWLGASAASVIAVIVELVRDPQRMMIATFAIFRHELPKSSVVFWLMLQIAMAIGFLTSYPVNALLIRKGVKERM